MIIISAASFPMLFEAPGAEDILQRQTFHMVLDIVRKITEEVDAGKLLQFVDVDDILRQIGIAAFLMLYLEAHGTVAGGVLHQHCHIVVLGNNHPVYGPRLILGRIVNGATLNNIECVLRAVLI